MNKELSLGHTVARANLKHPELVIPVGRLNYVCPEGRLPLPYPDGDWYLANTAVPAARYGEQIIANTMIPGLREYYERIGLLTSDMEIHEISPVVSGDRDVSYGFPATDALQNLSSSNVIFSDKRRVMFAATTFTSSHVREQFQTLGLKDMGLPDSYRTNNKAFLRESSKQYEISMLPGMILREEEDMFDASNRFGNTQYGVWLKFPTGSGGDLVYHVKNVTPEDIEYGRQAVRNAVSLAFEKGEFSEPLWDIWPNREAFPKELGGIVVETDARNMGEVLVNGSTQFVTNRFHRTEVVGHFKQMTTEEGEYLGNRPYPDIPPRVDYRIREQVAQVARYNMGENKYYGVQGVDWFRVLGPNGDEHIYIDELNSRPTANTPPVIIAQKLGIDSWINTNFYAPHEIRTIDDYVNIVGEDLAFGSKKDGLVVPQSFRTHVSEHGIVSSEKFKGLILGASPEHCDQITQRLEERGIRFTP